jgi:hypothetical protein
MCARGAHLVFDNYNAPIGGAFHVLAVGGEFFFPERGRPTVLKTTSFVISSTNCQRECVVRMIWSNVLESFWHDGNVNLEKGLQLHFKDMRQMQAVVLSLWT